MDCENASGRDLRSISIRKNESGFSNDMHHHADTGSFNKQQYFHADFHGDIRNRSPLRIDFCLRLYESINKNFHITVDNYLENIVCVSFEARGRSGLEGA